MINLTSTPMLDYFSLIQTYFPPESQAYRFYLPHVVQVTHESLAIGRSLGLNATQLHFIEEASMLHDIGICKVNAPEIGCHGSLDYLCHGSEGRTILEREGLPQHALVAERHTGVGIHKEEIEEQGLPLPIRDMLPVSIEEKIICWADLFYSKTPEKLWIRKSLEEVRAGVARFEPRAEADFERLGRELGQLS